MTRRFVLALAVALAGCGGFAPDTMPGEMALLFGSVAVDPDTETSFAIDFDETVDAEGVVTGFAPRNLVAVRPAGELAVVVQSLEGTDWTTEIAFAPGRVIVIARSVVSGDPALGTAEYESTIRAFDAESLAPTGEVRVTGSFHLDAQSASRRWALGAAWDVGFENRALVDLDALELYDIAASQPGSASFGFQTDRIFGIAELDDGPHLRAWSVDALVASELATDESGTWAAPSLDQPLGPDFSADARLQISPTDDFAFLPDPSALVDLGTGEVRSVDVEMSGAVFSPDGSTLVGYRDAEPGHDGGSWLITVDVETVLSTSVPLSFSGPPEFFVTRSGHEVVVAPYSYDGYSLLLVDLSDGTSTRAGGVGLHLGAFTSRVSAGEIWLVQDDSLYCLDLVAGETEGFATEGYDPWAINVLPERDLLVLRADAGLVFFDPSARAVTRTVPLR